MQSRKIGNFIAQTNVSSYLAVLAKSAQHCPSRPNGGLVDSLYPTRDHINYRSRQMIARFMVMNYNVCILPGLKLQMSMKLMSVVC